MRLYVFEKMTELERIKQPIAEELTRYVQLFDSVLTHEEDFMRRVLDYVRGRKGKMMRPILVLLLAKELGTIAEPTLHAAVSLELLHTSSLIHDDVVDESEERRGKASVRKVYDNKVAVLLGDYMLAKTLSQSAMTGHIGIVDAVARLGATLAEGEILQLSHVEQESFSETTYFKIIHRKTGALFEACGELAALSMHANADFLRRARTLGSLIGASFQIRDDIFDYYDDEAIGKPRGNDLLEGKLTLPLIYALKTDADPEALACAQRVKAMESTPEDRAFLIDYAKSRGGIAHAEAVMDDYRRQALELLAGFSNQEVREALQTYVDFVIGRNV